MKVSRVMTKDVTWVQPELPLATAWALMTHLRIRHLPVAFEGTLLGILSDRDLLVRALRSADGTYTFPQQTCGEVMTPRPVACVSSTPVSRIAALMLEHRIDSVPIVGTDNRLVGLVTSTDLLELLTEPEQISDVLPFSFQLRQADERMAHA